MKRLLLWLAGGAVCLVVVLAIIIWLGLRASLPQLDGAVSIAGLASRVSVERDADGIPVITASNRKDLAFATGYVHGQDRFFQMDLIRRQAAGELSELVGAAAIDVDKRYRFHRFRSRAQIIYAAATEAEQQLM